MRYLFLFVSALFLFLPRSFAASECEQAWSESFDQISASFFTEDEMGLLPFLQQNDVSGTDSWFAYRSFVLEHRCLLNAVCQSLELAPEQRETFVLNPSNARGGSLVGPFYACPKDMTLPQFFERANFSPDLERCDTETPEAIGGRAERILTCYQHAALLNTVFADTLTRALWSDVMRKHKAYITEFLHDFAGELEDLRKKAGNVKNLYDKVFSRMCTLSSS